MRTTQVLILFLLSVNVFAGSGEDQEGRSASTYTVTKTETNTKLKQNEAVLFVTFKCPTDNCEKSQIMFSINGDREIGAKVDRKEKFSHGLEAGKYIFVFWGTGLSSIQTDSIEFKGQTNVHMLVELRSRRMATRKPVIYLYPEKTQDVSLKLNYNGQLEFTYPEYKSGWNVTAHPDGTIESNGKEYNYLFWDGKMDSEKLKFDVNEGFVVSSTELTSFLDSTLTLMGLNSKETADFITYWAPMMMPKHKNYIHFMWNKDYDQIATINVSPKPNSQFRLFMVWTIFPPDGMPTVFIPQTLPQFERKGFTLIEWGGSEYPELFDTITH